MSNVESEQAFEEFRSSSEVDFYIHKDMVHIADTKVATRFSDFFIRQIHKLNEVNSALCLISDRTESSDLFFTLAFFLSSSR